MNRILRPLALALSVLTVAPVAARAQEKPINLALVAPIQIVPVEESVSAFRFSLIYGRNQSVRYADLGLVNHTDVKNEGVQLGVIGIGADFSGLQMNFGGAYDTGFLNGVQLSGLANWAESGEGVMAAGAFNGTQQFEGLQIALVNYAKDLRGVQVGLINIIVSGGLFGLPVFPFVNFRFED